MIMASIGDFSAAMHSRLVVESDLDVRYRSETIVLMLWTSSWFSAIYFCPQNV